MAACAITSKCHSPNFKLSKSLSALAIQIKILPVACKSLHGLPLPNFLVSSGTMLPAAFPVPASPAFSPFLEQATLSPTQGYGTPVSSVCHASSPLQLSLPLNIHVDSYLKPLNPR